MPSNNEITWIKEGPYPDRVMDEGDTLGIGAKIHSFYWKREALKAHDYEPVAILSKEKCGLARYHYSGLIIWQDYLTKNNKPVTYFAQMWHTPILCSRQCITYSKPSNRVDYIKLLGYLLPRISQRTKDTKNYEHKGYKDIITNDAIPSNRKFQWTDLDYYVLVAPFATIDHLPRQISRKIKQHISNI